MPGLLIDLSYINLLALGREGWKYLKCANVSTALWGYLNTEQKLVLAVGQLSMVWISPAEVHSILINRIAYHKCLIKISLLGAAKQTTPFFIILDNIYVQLLGKVSTCDDVRCLGMKNVKPI